MTVTAMAMAMAMTVRSLRRRSDEWDGDDCELSDVGRY